MGAAHLHDPRFHLRGHPADRTRSHRSADPPLRRDPHRRRDRRHKHNGSTARTTPRHRHLQPATRPRHPASHLLPPPHRQQNDRRQRDRHRRRRPTPTRRQRHHRTTPTTVGQMKQEPAPTDRCRALRIARRMSRAGPPRISRYPCRTKTTCRPSSFAIKSRRMSSTGQRSQRAALQRGSGRGMPDVSCR
jgi:hypothetical protein